MATKLHIGDILARATMFGIAGWVIENALCTEDRYSSLFRGHKVPFLPVYAAGGVAMTGVAPYVSKWPIVARGLTYAVLGTAVEYVGGQIDREIFHARSWDYGSRDALARVSDGHVNFVHSAMWGGLGLVAERFV
jgi:uncharacterized membrane protein